MELLRARPRPTALVCSCDAVARHAIRALAKRGMLLYKEAADGSIGSCKINTKFKGKQVSCLKLRLWALEGDTEEGARQVTVDDMTETDEDSPF